MKLAALFSDHAVLQRDRPVPVWGWTQPRTRVRVKLGVHLAETLSGADGRFIARLPPMSAGGPFTMEVTTSDSSERVVVNDVFVGEVWLCSGQSNMEMRLKETGSDGLKESEAADLPLLRSVTIPRLALAGRQSDVVAAWEVCNPETAGDFTAVGYHFARTLQARLHVPVGVVNASWGGTPVEAWISRESLVEDPELRLGVEYADATLNNSEFWRGTNPCDFSDPVQRDNFLAEKLCPADPGNMALGRGWAAPDCDDRTWETMRLPGSWQSQGHNYSGVFWFRRTVEIPAAWAGRDLVLGIGAVDKMDVTYFNGEPAGAMGKGFETQHWSTPRQYRVPGRLVKAGRNVIAVRVYSFIYAGGMLGPRDTMMLTPSGETGGGIPLHGEWKFAVEHNLGVVQPFACVPGPGNEKSSGILYDNMIAPLVPYAIRGALWYQGESNTATDADHYGARLERLIRDWRHVWGQGDFVFLTVQLPNYRADPAQERGNTWALVREAQLRSLALPETGLAVTIDIGEADDIHPRNKRDVGMRLAQWALVRAYGVAGVPAGPLFESATIEGDRIRIRFRHVGGGLVARGGSLRTCVVADMTREFHPAEAVIDGETLVVSSRQVRFPMAVRYAWANNPDGANLYNTEGLPASPFRTDNW
jgi:sialate O-acetylesterase